MVRDEDYGRLPPKKLKRFRELIEAGLESPRSVTQENLNEVAKLFLEAGGELPPDMEFRRGRLRRRAGERQ